MLAGRWWRAPFSDKVILVESLLELARVRAELSLGSFAGAHARTLARPVFPRERASAARVAWAFEALARHIPFFSNCLVQSLAAARVLKGHGHRPEVCFGAAKKTERALDAHAWVRLDGRVILGAVEREFTPFEALR